MDFNCVSELFPYKPLKTSITCIAKGYCNGLVLTVEVFVLNYCQLLLILYYYEKEVDLNNLKVSSFQTANLANPEVKGGASLMSCPFPGCNADTNQSCIPEECMAGITWPGEPGC